ncbi:MAG: UDP-N-acetylmuramoyl-L-alanyl-D-glutamate--2,6-diaminopimelate ligase [Succinivibrionaceae bacterium]|nr:UDP-N-acetylmuramoyl-L-alanyl-D-glutamate--2,6-diaminopimelate ligase [Succinivibrionaceae bacterium]
MRQLGELLEFLHLGTASAGDAPVMDLTCDSREVGKGSVFVARQGTAADGRDFAAAAVAAGALAVLVPHGQWREDLAGLGVPAHELPDNISEAELAAWFYRYPSDRLKVVGVTGTNGKTTVTQLFAQWMGLMGRRCAVLGTLGHGFLPRLERSANTTMEVYSLQRALARALAAGAEFAAMEVSSIGVEEGRIDGIAFAGGAMTNLTRDHLDYHGTMEAYQAAKEKFLHRVRAPRELVFDFDSEPVATMATAYENRIIVGCSEAFRQLYSEFTQERHLSLRATAFAPDHLGVEVDGTFGQGSCDLHLLGTFNLENFACTLGLMLAQGLPLERLLAAAPDLRPIPGRMEVFRAKGSPTVVVDYAHTPDGVEQALRAAREHHPEGEIWCVIGCGGDRDRGKRPIMAIKASVFADHAIFTSDNPRTEDPAAIIADMSAGVGEARNCTVIMDRAAAIRHAFSHAKERDCVLVAGKGHEDYQISGRKKIHYSDRELAAELTGATLD